MGIQPRHPVKPPFNAEEEEDKRVREPSDERSGTALAAMIAIQTYRTGSMLRRAGRRSERRRADTARPMKDAARVGVACLEARSGSRFSDSKPRSRRISLHASKPALALWIGAGSELPFTELCYPLGAIDESGDDWRLRSRQGVELAYGAPVEERVAHSPGTLCLDVGRAYSVPIPPRTAPLEQVGE